MMTVVNEGEAKGVVINATPTASEMVAQSSGIVKRVLNGSLAEGD